MTEYSFFWLNSLFNHPLHMFPCEIHDHSKRTLYEVQQLKSIKPYISVPQKHLHPFKAAVDQKIIVFNSRQDVTMC